MLGNLFQGFYKNITMRNKIIFLFIPLMTFFILLFGEISNSIYRHYIVELAKKDLAQRTERLKKDIEFRLLYYVNVSDYLFIDQTLREILSEYSQKEKEYTDVFDDYTKLNKIFNYYESLFRCIPRIYLYESYLPLDGKYTMPISVYPACRILEKMKNDTGKIYWAYENIEINDLNRPFLIIGRVIKNNQGTPLAILNVEIEKTVIEEVVKTVDIGKNGWCIYRFEDGQPIINIEQVQSNHREKALVVTEKINMNNSILEIGYPEDIITEMGREQRKSLILILFLFIMSGIGMTFFFSKLVVKRMQLFVKKIEKIHSGKSDPVIIDGRDEIALIDRNFSLMLRRLNENTEREHRLEMEKKMIEFELMQAQFNPHFLYNTLSAVRWSVIKNGDEKSGDVLVKLIMFYRAVLSGGKHIIPIIKELEIIKWYIEIQQYTYDHYYKVNFNTAPEVNNLYTIKFILQPIVENAILHGLKDRKEDGEISISADIVAGKVRFIIEDNGKGLSEEELTYLNGLDAIDGPVMKRSGCGYGILNVIRRIKLFYGKNYGLHYDSTMKRGTRVTVTIPICENEENNIIF